jgi:hypothetical protein
MTVQEFEAPAAVEWSGLLLALGGMSEATGTRRAEAMGLLRAEWKSMVAELLGRG